MSQDASPAFEVEGKLRKAQKAFLETARELEAIEERLAELSATLSGAAKGKKIVRGGLLRDAIDTLKALGKSDDHASPEYQEMSAAASAWTLERLREESEPVTDIEKAARP